MNRRTLLKGGTLAATLAALGFGASRAFGGNRYYSGPPSDHFDGKRFFNPGGTPPNSFGDLLRWRREGGRAEWPASVPVIPARPAAQVEDLTITMVGHATLLIQTAGLNLLTDPVWSDRASPVSFAGAKARHRAGSGLRRPSSHRCRAADAQPL